MRRARALAISALFLVLISACQNNIRAVTATPTPLSASGTISATEVRLASELGGRVLKIQAQVGDTVQVGDLLVELDTALLLAQLAQADAAVVTAQADLALARSGASPEQIAPAREAVTLAQTQREGAYATWQDARAAVENPQQLDAQIVQARLQVALAEQQVEGAEAALRAQEIMRDRHAPGGSDWQVQAAEEALAAAEADQRTAQTLLNHLSAMRRQPLGLMAQRNAAEGRYHVAEAGVAIAQARLDDLLAGATPEQVAVAEAAWRQAQAQANVLRVQIAKGKLPSPLQGIVLRQPVQEGEIVASATTILVLGDLKEVSLDVDVPENRIGQVRLEQTVRVMVDSFPGQAFEGHVTGIGSEAEFTPRNTATIEKRLNTFFVVHIRLPNSEGLLKPGMPADATF